MFNLYFTNSEIDLLIESINIHKKSIKELNKKEKKYSKIKNNSNDLGLLHEIEKRLINYKVFK